MNKESKSLDNVKGSKVDTNKVQGGKMDVPRDAMKELDMKDIAIDRGMEKGTRERGVK
jgi:hypothetical protein